MYGSQNGWKEYTQKLINKLEQDKNNECIDNISKFYEADTKQVEYNKKEILRFLKELKQ
jgi:formate dehydrogenase maturation protein FdhE